MPFGIPVNLSDPRCEAGFNLLNNQTEEVSQKNTKMPAGNESRAEQDVLFSLLLFPEDIKSRFRNRFTATVIKCMDVRRADTHTHTFKKKKRKTVPFVFDELVL